MAGQKDRAKPQPAQRESQVRAADVSALTGAAAPPATTPKPAKPWLSEGMRSDLETLGYAVDPVSGARFELDRETGEVTVTEKPTTDAQGKTVAGKVSTVDVPVRVPPSSVDPETGETTTTDPATGETLTTDPETGVVTAHNPSTGETRVVEQN